MSADILIKIENLKKSFQGGLEALKGVNLEIQRGEILALLAPMVLEKLHSLMQYAV